MNSGERHPVATVFAALGSLKLTVVLLAMSIFIVFAGTLAQVDKGIWTVVEQYFRCPIAMVELKIFFPRDWNVGGKLPFPGGWLIGAVLLVNLLVSHLRRIQVQARGRRLLIGSIALAVGSALTFYVIAHVFDLDSSQKTQDPSWRVTRQLIQGAGAAAVLYVGCWLLFKRKAGIVLLHAGVVILMVSELATGIGAEEGTMTIFEGQKIDYVEDTRSVELAIIDPSDPQKDDVHAIPVSLLQGSKPILVPTLPFDLLPGRYVKNAVIEPLHPGEINPATRGAGLRWHVHERPEETGVDTAGRVDLPAMYLSIKERAGGADLGSWLVAVRLTIEKGMQTLRVGGKDYRFGLRFKRTYKPYSIALHKFKFDRYTGTETAKNFSSDVRVEDPGRGVVRDVRIWMNNPLRYRGDTLYQSSFDAETEAGTVLQVVDNKGWMAPYVACMVVAVGMLGQFLLHLFGFLRKLVAA